MAADEHQAVIFEKGIVETQHFVEKGVFLYA